MTDLERLPDTDELRRRLSCDQGDNLARNDLAVGLHLRGNLEGALEVLSTGPSPGLGSGLVRINRLYLGEAREARRAYERQLAEDPGLRVVKIVRPRQERPPLVSVIMPTYNRAGKIRPSVESVLAQTFQDFELVIVNDGGDPAVERVVREFGSERIMYVDAVHKGLAGALNLGVHLARGRYIARLDDDDIYFPPHLELTAGLLEKSAAAAVYAGHEAREQELRGGEWVTVSTQAVPAPEWDLAAFEWKMFFTSNNVMIRRSALDEAGPYNEYFPTREDWEFYLRVGRRFGYTPLPQITSAYNLRRDASNMTNYNRLGFHHYANLIGHLHGLYSLTSSLWEPYGKTTAKVRKVIRGLDRMEALDPGAIRPVYVKKLALLAEKKAYAFFLEWGANLAACAETAHLARAAFREALRQGPFEPRAWRAWAKAGLAGTETMGG